MTSLIPQPRAPIAAMPLLPLSDGIQVQAEAEHLLKNAETEILYVANDSPFQLAPTVTTWYADLAFRGVTLRTLAHKPKRGHPAPTCADIPTQNAIRFAEMMPPILLIADRQTAILATSNPSPHALLVADPALAAVMATIFDQSWLHATPALQNSPPANAAEPAETDLALVRLLAAGHTDETVARLLGVSLRTIRRRIATIMIRLDAGSRFEAGINVARRGWL